MTDTGNPSKESPFHLAAAMLEGLPMLLWHARTTSGLSMRDVAAELGCAVATIHGIEHGRHSPSVDLAARILRFIGDHP